MPERVSLFDPTQPQPGEAIQVAGAQLAVLPLVTRVLLAIEDGSLFLVECNDGRTWTVQPRDEHDGLRFVGRPRRDD